MTIFRGGKCFAAPIFAETIEKFIVDLGDGSNGKTLLQRIAEVSFGDYAEQIKETMMTKDPPPPGGACPDLLNMRGVLPLHPRGRDDAGHQKLLDKEAA